MKTRTSLALALLLLLPAVPAAAENWPHWRGPDRNGTASGAAPLTWSATLTGGTSFTLAGAKSGSIGAQTSIKLVLSGQPLSASAVPGQALTATLTLDTNDADQPRHTVPLSVISVPVTVVAPSTAELVVTVPIVVPLTTGASMAFLLPLAATPSVL